MIKVIVVSDIKIYCEGLSHILSKNSPICIVGSETTFEGAVHAVELNSPDVILLDMSISSSSEIAQNLIRLCPSAKIVALAVSEDQHNIIQCVEVGITGYVPREASVEELVSTVKRAKKGEFYCPPRIAACVFKTLQSMKKSANDVCNSIVRHESLINSDMLTRREKQIVHLMSDGLSNKLISRKLSIEVSTVKNHVHNILVKLDVKNRTQAVLLLQRKSLSDANKPLGLDPEPGLEHHLRPTV